MKLLLVFLLITILKFTTANIEIAPKIVGGQDADPGQFPYMVSFKFKGYPTSHICGAGILNERWILTAAHCTTPFEPGQVVVVVGSVIIDEGGVTYDVERLIAHPHYVPASIQRIITISINDIALIKTTTRIIFNQFTQPVPLLRRHIINPTPVTLAGFGAYFANISYPRPDVLYMSRHLQFINTRTITYNECSFRTQMINIFDQNFPVKIMIDPFSNICTLQPRGVGACFGDSGSMLTSNGEVVGVVSAGVRPCAQGAPDIFTRVSALIGWIESYIRDLS